MGVGAPSVFFYVSGHGFGHSSRQVEIINALGASAKGALDVVVRTSAPRWLFDRTVRVPITYIEGAVDTGVVQFDSLRLDERETIRRAAAFHRALAGKAREEAALLRARHARLVISDAPALGCAAAAAAAVPSVVCSNFTWDWIYAGYPDSRKEGPDLVPTIDAAYRQADAAWRLPMHGGFASFSRIEDTPFVARHAQHDRAHVRKVLGLPHERPIVLCSFGGYGVQGLDPSRLDCLDRYTVLITVRAPCPPLPEGVRAIDEEVIYGRGLRYEDLVAAVDVVATKPGYGIVSECVANGAAVLYTSRGRFVEYDVLAGEMPRFLRCGFIDNAALLSGRWREALDRIVALPRAPERPATNGAEIVAEKIIERVRWGSKVPCEGLGGSAASRAGLEKANEEAN